MTAATHHTKEEAVAKIGAMTREEWRTTFIYARFLVKRSKESLSFEELADEAVARTLEGRRHWKVGLNGPNHLFGAMKSILSSWNKAAKRRQSVIVNISSMVPEVGYDLGGGHPDMVARIAGAAENLISASNLSEFEEQVLTGLLAGEDTDVILREVGMGVDEYRNTISALVGKISSDD